jgi:hypothetical protein
MKNTRKSKMRYLKSALIAGVLLFCFSAVSMAAEMRFYVPSFEGEELAKVREWEKHWVGKKIDGTNVDQVSEFLMPPLVKVMKDPEWMRMKEFWFEIIPYEEAYRSKGQIEMTKKNAPNAKIVDDDILDNYQQMAGFIFPEPKTGLEVAYNCDMQTYGDSRYDGPNGSVVEPRTGYERWSQRLVTMQFWSGRVYSEPYGNHPKNKKDIRRMQHSLMTSPPDFNGNVILELKYNNVERDTDKWVFMKRFRRTRRVSTAQRGDQIDGTEIIYDDSPGFWGDHYNRNNYKIMGRKDLLLGRRSDISKVIREKAAGAYSGLQRERVNTWMVEVIYKQEHYPYSKQVWYVDPETWIVQTKDCWDEDGEYWRFHEESYMKTKTVSGEYAYTPLTRIGWDMVGRHCSHNLTEFIEKVGEEFPVRMFSVHSIQKSR